MKDYKQSWKIIAEANNISAHHVVERAILKAMSAKTNADRVKIAYSILMRAFSPITNPNKLSNGRRPFDTLEREVAAVKSLGTRYGALNDPKFFDGDAENEAIYMAIVTELAELVKNPKAREYAYFIVDADLSPEQKVVQTAHVAQKFGAANPTLNADSTHYVVLEASDFETAVSRFPNATKFEDFGQVTAIVAGPIAWNDARRSNFASYKLLKFA
jgi:hypothetical protein